MKKTTTLESILDDLYRAEPSSRRLRFDLL